MTNIVRWEPFRDMVTLREAMDRLFNDAWLRPTPGWDGEWSGPALDLVEKPDEIVVKAALPGIKPDDLKITLIGDVLNISGEINEESEQKDARYHLRERRYGAFSRSISLPTPVQPDKVKAEFENGVATLTLPKSEAVKPKSITIKVK